MQSAATMNPDVWNQLSTVEQNVCTLGFGSLDKNRDIAEQVVEMTGKSKDFVKIVFEKHGYNTYEAIGSLLNMTPAEAWKIEVEAVKKLTLGLVE